jgi:hypothetical protein
MAKWNVRLPLIGAATGSHKVGLEIVSATETTLFTLSPNGSPNECPIEIPVLSPQGADVDVNHKPVIIRIRCFPNAGSGGTAITPVPVDRRIKRAAGFVVNRHTTPPGGTEEALVYEELMYPQSRLRDAYLDPQDGTTLALLEPGKHYNFTVEFPWYASGVFDLAFRAMARD